MRASTSATAIAIACTATLAIGVTTAQAATGSAHSTDFTGVTLSTVSDPSVWHMTGPYDAAVVTVGGNSALRMSNATTSGSFGDMIFSPTLAVPATIDSSVHTFTASFTLLPVALQPGLRTTVSPDNGSGGRAGFLAIEHTTIGMDLTIAGSYVDANDDVTFDYQKIATGLDPAVARTITMKVVKKPNTKKDQNNDTFSVQLQGKPARTTTFEAYYAATGEPNYATDTLLFRLSASNAFPAAPQYRGFGFLVDNVMLSTS